MSSAEPRACAPIRVVALLACHNRRDATLACLESLRPPSWVDLDVVLVDDGCTDGTGDAVTARFPKVDIVIGTGSLYWCRGMALAWEHAAPPDPDFVLWLNDDVLLDDDALERFLADAVDAQEEAPTTGAVVVGSLRDPHTNEHAYGGFVRTSGWHPGKLAPVMPDAEHRRRVDTLNGNLVAVPRQAERLVGRIDGSFSHATGDVDYGLRCGQAGVPVMLGRGYHGTCVRNHGDLSSLRTLFGRKGLPPADWLRYTRRHGRWPWWLLAFLAPYARSVATSVGARTPRRQRRSDVVWFMPGFRQYRRRVVELAVEEMDRRGRRLSVCHAHVPLPTNQGGELADTGGSRPLRARRWDLRGREILVTSLPPGWLSAKLFVASENTGCPTLWFIIIVRRLLRRPTAVFGHGCDFANVERDNLAERLNIWRMGLVDWWYAYNDLSRRAVLQRGFPPERITTVMNTLDTEGLRAVADASTTEGLRALRSELGLPDGPIGLFIGALYPAKQVPLLVESLDSVRERVPGFGFLVVGDGSEADEVAELAAARDWMVRLPGDTTEERGRYWALADVALYPASAGLSLNEAFALGVVPLVSSAFPHGVEVDYVEHDRNGVVVPATGGTSNDEMRHFATHIADLLEDNERLERLRAAARSTGGQLTVERMVERFVDGAVRALDAPRWQRGSGA